MRILFFSHYFPPEVNAPASRTYEHCVRWARAGHDVAVITCVPNCPDGKAYHGYRSRWTRQVETVDGIRVVRVWTHLAANAGSIRRTFNYVSFLVSAVLSSFRERRPDVIVATSPQFFCGWAGVVSSWLKRVPFVLEVRDIWPESIAAVNAVRNRPAIRFLEFLERRMYLSADRIVTVGEGYRTRILQRADVAARTEVVTNGVDLRQFAPAPSDRAFLQEFDLQGKFVCSYVGTIGMAHGLEVVIEAARILKARRRDDIRFCLVGDGARRATLATRAREAGVESLVVFTGRQLKERMPAILASTNACLVHLRGCELFGTVIPSKIFEILAMGCPMIVGVRGEARTIVERAGGGIAMEPDSAESLVDCVVQLANDSNYRDRLAASARSYVEVHYNRDVLAQRMLDVLADASGLTSAQQAARPASRDPVGDLSASPAPAAALLGKSTPATTTNDKAD